MPKVIYKTTRETSFEVDGDRTRILEIEGSKDYVLDWMRGKLRKMENGQIKIFKSSSLGGARDWEQEEKIKKQLWEDINVNEYPVGVDFEDEVIYKTLTRMHDNTIICTKPLQTRTQTIEYKRPPSPPCKIS